MAKTAVQYKMTTQAAPPPGAARVIDFRTRRPWRPAEVTNWTFLFDIGLTFLLVLLGAWLFLKMQGG